ncbi:MAG: hypothetical protein JSS62_05465, partial [Verrucomicrobia bacterium]|nr:hypothetical protein [Verrucomicrobiota bacterium]
MMFIRHSLYFIFLTFGASSLLALPTLNPWEYALTNRTSNLPILENHPDLSFRLGFLGDYVLNRKLETSENQTNSDIQKTTLKTHQGLISLTMNKRLDFYAGLGASSLTLKTPASSFNYHFSGTLSVVVVPFPAPLATYSGNNIPTFDPNSPLSLITNPSFSYTLGLSSILWKGKNLAISAAGSYFYTNPNVARAVLKKSS